MLGERGNPTGDAPQAVSATPLLPERDQGRVCPRCSQLLRERSCKLICFRCGFYLSCSDF